MLSSKKKEWGKIVNKSTHKSFLNNLKYSHFDIYYFETTLNQF